MFFRSILILVASAFAIMVPYSIGHGLSTHHATPLIVGAGFGVAAAALVALLARPARGVRSRAHH